MLRRQIFRQESLEKLSSPDQMDHLFLVVGTRVWIAVAALGTLCLAALLWAVFGRIPETVDGVGVLINPGNVRALQAPHAGQVVELRIRVGQTVQHGDVIAVTSQPEIQQQLQQAEARLAEVTALNSADAELDKKRAELETASINVQKGLLDEAIKTAEELVKTIQETNQVYNKMTRQTIQKVKDLSLELSRSLQRRQDSVRRLRTQKATTEDAVLAAESSYLDSASQVANLELRLFEIELKDLETQRAYLQEKGQVSELKIQYQKLEIREQQLRQEMLQDEASRKTRRQQEVDRIAQLRLQLERHSKVQSEYAGRILEVTASPGQVLATGAKVAAVELDDAAAELTSLAYFPVKSGKRIREAMAVRVSPTPVQRERFGSILGTVTKVSPFPVTEEAASTAIGSTAIVQALAQPGGMIEIEARLERDPQSPSGYRWTSAGPPLTLSAGTTTNVRVTLEERAPITYLLPILRATLLGEGDQP